MAFVLSRADAEGKETILEALEPPNRINQQTGLPFGWTDENELDGLDSLLTG